MKPSRRVVEPFAAFTARFPQAGTPWLALYPFRHLAHLHWGDGDLRWYGAFAQYLDGSTLKTTVFALFEAHRPTLPRKSELSSGGGVHGAWVSCPGTLVPAVFAVVRQHFEAALEQVMAWRDEAERQGWSPLEAQEHVHDLVALRGRQD